MSPIPQVADAEAKQLQLTRMKRRATGLLVVMGVVFGAADPKAGAAGTLYNFAADPRLNHNAEVIRGVNAEECAELLEAFFRTRRQA